MHQGVGVGDGGFTESFHGSVLPKHCPYANSGVPVGGSKDNGETYFFTLILKIRLTKRIKIKKIPSQKNMVDRPN